MPSNVTRIHNPLHHDAEWLKQAIAEGKNSRTISLELNVSYKLVEVKLAEFGIPFDSQKPTF